MSKKQVAKKTPPAKHESNVRIHDESRLSLPFLARDWSTYSLVQHYEPKIKPLTFNGKSPATAVVINIISAKRTCNVTPSIVLPKIQNVN